jgi:hypothetical protein
MYNKSIHISGACLIFYFCTITDQLKYPTHAAMIIKLSVLSVIVTLIVPVRCGIRSIRRLSTLTRMLMTTGVTRSILAALKMVELSPAKLRSGPIRIT